MRRPDPKEMFKRADKNSDGKLTKDEVPERIWEHMSKADADKDGALTPEELKKAFEARMSRAKSGEKKEDKEKQKK